MAFSAKKCRKRDASKKRCSQPAVAGSHFCRLHGGTRATASPEGTGKDVTPPPPRRRRGQGSKTGNTNAIRHGAYSTRLLPEEEPIYEEKRKAFTSAVGTVDVFDEQILHLLSLIAVKIDQAVMRGADHTAYGGMIKQLLDLMREMKSTRASRDPVDAGACLTYADLFAALKAQWGERFGTEPLDPGESAGDRACPRCGFTMPHLRMGDGRLVCQNCGHATLEIVQLVPDVVGAGG